MPVNREVGPAAAILENLPTNTKRTDALEAAQVDGWWSGVEQLGNRRPRRPSRWPAGGLAWSSGATADPEAAQVAGWWPGVEQLGN